MGFKEKRKRVIDRINEEGALTVINESVNLKPTSASNDMRISTTSKMDVENILINMKEYSDLTKRMLKVKLLDLSNF